MGIVECKMTIAKYIKVSKVARKTLIPASDIGEWPLMFRFIFQRSQ